jgi:glycosyltransferase involved in cell wall biosynthesis
MIVTIYYAGFARFGGVISHVRSIEAELLKLGWRVNVITLDKLPFWCRYIPHLIEKTINLVNRPMGFLYKDLATRVLYKLFFNKKDNLRIFEDIYISWNSEIPSITILHALWSDNLQSFSIRPKLKSKLKMHEVKIIEAIKHPIATVSYPYLKYIKKDHFSKDISKKIDVIELGVDQSKYHNNPSSDSKSIVYVGTLEARKNIKFLLQIFKRLLEVQSSYSLTIIGDGPERRQLEDFAKNNGLQVLFLGALSHDAVIHELPKHGIYLHTSVKESFSYALLEAKLAGLKTCAYAKLQVPMEFIDIPIANMDVDEWCNEILNSSCITRPFEGGKFTVERMTSLTLGLSK